MRRRILLVITAAVLSFALSGCAGKGDKAGSASASEKTAKTAETPAPADTTPPVSARVGRAEQTPPAPPAPPRRTPKAAVQATQAAPAPATSPPPVIPAPKPVAGRPYYPFGETGATVIIRPVGEAFISLVNGKIDKSGGKPVPVVEGLSKGYYDRVAMPPGKVSVRIGSVSTST